MAGHGSMERAAKDVKTDCIAETGKEYQVDARNLAFEPRLWFGPQPTITLESLRKSERFASQD